MRTDLVCLSLAQHTAALSSENNFMFSQTRIYSCAPVCPAAQSPLVIGEGVLFHFSPFLFHETTARTPTTTHTCNPLFAPPLPLFPLFIVLAEFPWRRVKNFTPLPNVSCDCEMREWGGGGVPQGVGLTPSASC